MNNGEEIDSGEHRSSEAFSSKQDTDLSDWIAKDCKTD
jgi:hypothetical protein